MTEKNSNSSSSKLSHPEKLPKEEKAKFLDSLGRILFEAFTTNYSATAELLGKMVWPSIFFMTVLVFQGQIKSFLLATIDNLSHAQSIKIQGVEVAFFATDSAIPDDPLAHAILASLSTEELEYLLLIGDSEVWESTQSENYETTKKPVLASLEAFELIQVDYDFVPEGCSEGDQDIFCQPDVLVTMTGLGSRAYDSLVATLISIMQEIPDVAVETVDQ